MPTHNGHSLNGHSEGLQISGTAGQNGRPGAASIPVDWERLARATAHPLRVSILEILGIDGGRVLSPSDLSRELQIPLSNTNYHVTELAKSGLIELVRDPRAGAVVTFTGVTRDVSHLDYEAYVPMAERQMQEIVSAAIERHGLCAAAAEHRIGIVPLSEPAVVVAASAPHRGPAFDGAREIIDRSIAIVRPGVTTADVVAEWPRAQEFGFPDEEAAFALQYGHGVGLSIWEKPIFSRLVSLDHPEVLEQGMVFALETYWPSADGLGAARIEEELVVTENGCEVITKFPAEELLVAGQRYYTVGGQLSTIRDSQSHLNTEAGRKAFGR